MAQVRERRPDVLVEGPIQYDAAVDPGIAAIKIKVWGMHGGQHTPALPVCIMSLVGAVWSASPAAAAHAHVKQGTGSRVFAG